MKKKRKMGSQNILQKKGLLRSRNKEISIKELVLFPSSKCNLNCKHCSYLCNSLESNNVSIERLKSIIDEAIAVGVKLFILVAKEPLMEIKRTKTILEHLDKRGARYGIVTNGTLIKSKIEDLRGFNFDYFDISIDGLKGDHDKTRGKGNFDRAKEGVEIVLKNKLTDKFFISSVLMSYNCKNIPEMIKCFVKLGVKNFSLGVYVYVKKNPKEWILKKEQLKELIPELCKIEGVNQIIIDIHKQANSYWEYLIDNGFIDKNKIKVDSNNVIFYRIPNSSLFLKNSKFTTTFWNTGIITTDGYYLDDYEYLGFPDYNKFAIGNIKDYSLKELINKVKMKHLKSVKNLLHPTTEVH